MSIVNKEIDELTGVQKVAIIILTLSEANAVKVLSLMNEEEITEISYAMSNLGNVNYDLIKSVMTKLTEEMSSGLGFSGNFHTTENLLTKILDKQTLNRLMEEIKAPRGSDIWEKLNNVNAEQLAEYFKHEHLQTVALILSKLSPSHAAKILSNLPEDFALKIISRILNMGNIKKEALDQVEKILHIDFLNNNSKKFEPSSMEVVLDIFNRLDKEKAESMMFLLKNNFPQIAKKIKDIKFTFNDLIRIDALGMQHLLRKIDITKLTLALKGTSEQIRKILFTNMPEKVVDILQENLLILNSEKPSDIELAQMEILAIAKILIKKGEIKFEPDANSEEYII